MKKASSVFIVLTIAFIVITSISFNIRTANAETTNYTISRVDHKVEVMYNGYAFINDTVAITGQAPNSFLLGFPYKYGQYILRVVAYNTLNASDVFPVTLNVPLENHIGFYGVRVDFPNGAPSTFSVGFVLSNELLTVSATNSYVLDFPAYPSLTQTTENFNATILLPEGAENVTVTKEDGITDAVTYVKGNLSAFTYSPATVAFDVSGDKIQKIDITELEREITVTELDQIAGSDTYHMMNMAPANLSTVEVILPLNASNPSAYDQFGRIFTNTPIQTNATVNRYRITFTLPLETNESTIFTVKYNLLSGLVAQEGTNNFHLALPLFQNVNYYIDQASASFVLPEGATISSFTNTQNSVDYSITRNVFQETVTFSIQGFISLDSFNMEILYSFNPLWISFHPTLWVWATALLGCAIALVWKRPTAPTKVAVPAVTPGLSSELLKSFVEAYEEKRKILLEIASLESRVQKGKIPRRRYKVQRITLETRVNALSRNLAESREKIRVTGGHYGELMRQLEVAETEINEVEANMRSIEARHGRGEISLETYRKLLADYQRRREKADTTISGILLRLREEIR